MSGPSNGNVARYTDKYFLRTKAVVERFGDCQVTYAVFMRRPVLFAPRMALDWLNRVLADRGVGIQIDPRFKEGDWVGAGEPMMYLTGSLAGLVDLETILLQRLGPCCVAAFNAYNMCTDLPRVGFLAMDARHCAGAEMAEMMSYAASVGSAEAKRRAGAVGFTGTSVEATAHFFGKAKAMGTMPHALIGYAGSTLRAAEMFRETYPELPLTVLVDYFGLEITDALAVCNRFPELAHGGDLSIRLDTHGGRYVEGLDTASSYAVLEKHVPDAIRTYRTEQELRWLTGTGVSAAAIWYVRESLDNAGFPRVKIIASSGFSPQKCKLMASVRAPIDVVGTGSYLPDQWTETYATADIISYDGEYRVKVGREFLFPNKEARARQL
ncbi:MAG TPA: nicotinate phosphoribosyltransferase [Geminicoccus sp.]|jgi:nicotinate phosphoribosyltransferase|uniref:nicotinate phosphoribosyltransferase n=1 Tax=Geminicoccus sp. TaxID=2024832 RepID=UPI002E362507|nr:nicotinate phosphoribosyltransferase [Geminicoccus sp.]HEX2525685.1 nicotinate phosphoribosyltransferase [Geminicoccus sp.]